MRLKKVDETNLKCTIYYISLSMGELKLLFVDEYILCTFLT